MNLSRNLGLSLAVTGIVGVALLGASATRHGAAVIPAANASEKWTLPMAEQPACRSTVPASIGGPMPDGDTVVIRWLGTANYEVAYHGKVIVMDTFFDRPARTRSVGFTPEQVKRADAILVGHAHYDHISDIATVAAQTQAPVLGSAITTAEAVTLGVPAAQTITVAGDNTEHFRYGDIRIQPTHIIHSNIEPTLIPELSSLYASDGLGPLTPEEAAQGAAVHAKGSSDPNILTLGTMGFTLTLPGDFTIVWFDSVSSISPEEEELATQLHHHVDVGLFPYTPHPIAETQLSYSFQHVQLFAPHLFMPTHHDHIWGAWLDNGVQPLFMKLRDEQPETKFAAPLYRSAVCIATSGPRRGDFIVHN